MLKWLKVAHCMFSDCSHLFWAVSTVLTEVLTTFLTFLLFTVSLSVQLSRTAQLLIGSTNMIQKIFADLDFSSMYLALRFEWPLSSWIYQSVIKQWSDVLLFSCMVFPRQKYIVFRLFLPLEGSFFSFSDKPLPNLELRQNIIRKKKSIINYWQR